MIGPKVFGDVSLCAQQERNDEVYVIAPERCAPPVIEIAFVAADGSRERVYTREGYTLMEAAVRSGVPGILAQCGGACACATCHVVVDPEWTDVVGPPNSMEDQLLEMVDRQPGSRLGCQVKLRPAFDGLVVHVPDTE